MHAGKQLMQVWDRLCHLLRMRQISVEDVSNKVGKILALSWLSLRLTSTYDSLLLHHCFALRHFVTDGA